MLNILKMDLRRTFRTGRMLYILVGSLIAVGIMTLMVKVFAFLPGEQYAVSDLFYIGTREGLFAITQCLFVIAMIVVDYEYGNIKNIASVTKKRSDFIKGKLVYAYVLSLVSSLICIVILTVAAMMIFPGKVTLGNPVTLVQTLILYTVIVDFPLTLVALFAMILKRASYCTYVLIAMYFAPGMAYGMVNNFLHIPISKISVLQYVFGQMAPFKMSSMMFHAGLALVYTIILFIVTVRIADRSDAL